MTMRTYTRKRPDHQVIEDVHSLCRLCLVRAEQSVPIFTQQTGLCALATRIMICVGLEITNEECLPNVICSNCLEMLEQYYSFRKKCESSYLKLKLHQAAIKIMNNKEEPTGKDKDKESVKTSTSLPLTQKLKIEEAKNTYYFKLDSNGIVQICDEHSKNNFTKHKLVSIVKIDPHLKKGDQHISTENMTNTEEHTKNNYESNNNSNRNENNIRCDFVLGNENIEMTQSDKQYERYEQNIIVSMEENPNITGVNNTEVKQKNTVDSNSKNTAEMNQLVIEPIASRNTTNNIDVLDVNHVVIDTNIVMENSELVDDTLQGNLVITERDTNEVAADGLINIIGHNQIDQHSSGLPDVLTTTLLGLGILTRNGGSLDVLDRTRTVALQTQDGNQFTLEFVEEPAAGQNIQEVTADEKKANDPVHKNKTKKLSKDFAVLFENKAKCLVCGKGFASNGGLKRHVRSVHGKQRPHKCRVCGRAFGQKEVMLRHELVHSERRPFQCESCPKSFTQRNALQAHARSHAPPQARALQLYRCARCPKVFLYPSGLSRHTMTHSGRVFVCSGCQKAFKDKSSLKRHMNNIKHGQVILTTNIQPASDKQAEPST